MEDTHPHGVPESPSSPHIPDMGTTIGRKKKNLLRKASLILPFALPAFVLAVWLAGQSNGEGTEPLHIIASIDADGGQTTTISTILTDGNEAIWTCSGGTFLETVVPRRKLYGPCPLE